MKIVTTAKCMIVPSQTSVRHAHGALHYYYYYYCHQDVNNGKTCIFLFDSSPFCASVVFVWRLCYINTIYRITSQLSQNVPPSLVKYYVTIFLTRAHTRKREQ